MISSLFTPYHLGRRFSVKFLAAGQLILLLVVWSVAPASLGVPSPLGILAAWHDMAANNGLLLELFKSMQVIAFGILGSTLIAWLIACLYTADAFKPLGNLASAFRFLGFAGLTFLFTLWTSSQFGLKAALLTFGMTVFLATMLIAMVKEVPQSEIDYARSLGLSGWSLTWELMVRGRADVVLDAVRQNAAVGWTLLAMVEGITRSDGGVGAMLLTQNKFFNMEAVFAIQLTILAYGLLQDYALSALRRTLCPWTRLNRSDK